ncbi:hypothetical protein COO60DRAFT_26268 [Scenedesmus sp. NREL 46B-D3]|nr:hypothetical protein COO60DRAFT_26268 [Scenedesmus sp. NREL 46B-D3]
MAFEAYEPSVVVDEFARKIDSLCVWDDTLIAGLSDGSLLFFQEQQQQQGNEQGPGRVLSSWQVTRVQKSFGKRGVQQLQALENQPYLLSLSDDGVQLHSLPELQLLSAASRTARGAAAFAWDEGRQLLVTAVRKKVISHQLDSSHTFLEMTEYDLPEPASCLTWVGSNILLGTPRSYWLIVPAASQAVEVLPGQVVMMYPAVQPQLLFAAGPSHAPVLTRLAAGEALVTKDSVSYFLGPDGKPSRKTTLSWSQPPNALVAGRLYVAALLPGCIEVKSISRVGASAAEQTLLLPGMSVAAPTPSSGGCLYAASAADKGIRQLRPVPLERQAKLLAAAGDFQGALELLTLMEDEAAAAAAAAAGSEAGDEAAGTASTAAAVAAAAAKRQQLEDVLRLKFGYHLFETGEPDEALTQFSMCSEPDPLLLLRLYPSLVPDKFLPLLPSSAYGEPLPDMPAAAAAADTGGSSSSSSTNTKGGGAADVAGAVSVVVPYLLSHRTRLLASLEEATAAAAASAEQQQQQQQGEAPGPAEAKLANGEAAAAPASSTSSSSTRQRSQQELQLVATVIDTAILRAMLLQPDSGALLRLLQQTNFVDLEDGEAILTAAGRYAELAALYQYNRQHAQGLQLLQQLSRSPAALPSPPSGAAADLKGLPGVWAAVRYLTAMQPQDLQLLVAHAGWVLGADPEAGLEALLAMNPPLKPDLVMPIMQEHAPTYTAVYLESALDLGLASPGEVHSELLLIYLHMALEEERDGEQSSAAHARQLSLSDLLVSRPRQLLKLFPDDKSQWGAPTPRASQSGAAAASPAAAETQQGAATASGAAAAAGEGGEGGKAADDGRARAVAGSVALSDPNHPQHRSDAYQRLRELVYASEHIDPEYVLSKLGQGQLLEIRALMLERLGRHREALSVYIHDLRAMRLAEEYCDRVYEAGLAQTAAGAAGGSSAGGAAAAAGDDRQEGTAAASAGASAGADARDAAGGAAENRKGANGSSTAGSWGLHRRMPSSGGSSRATGMLGGQLPAGSPASTGRLAGAAAGASWGRVVPGKLQQQQQARQQAVQQQRRPGRRQLGQAGRRTWAAMPFGAQPHDIYMELVDAVMQGPSTQQGDRAAAGAAAAFRYHQHPQQQQQQQEVAVDREAWQQLAQLLAKKVDRISHLQVRRPATMVSLLLGVWAAQDKGQLL